MPNELLEKALTYAEKMGWKLHPCKQDKTPHLNAWQDKATDNPEQIKKWWQKWPDASIGCKCGPDSEIFVLDIDLPDGPDTIKQLQNEHGKLPNTLKQKTGSGGMQMFFRYNGKRIRNSSRKIGSCLDIRGDGGYTILPPSSHPSGGQYEWLKKTKIADAPDWLINLTEKPEPTFTPPTQGGNTPYGLSALAQEIIKLSGTVEGSRNQTLNDCAFNLGQLIAGGELEEGHTINSLLGVALSVGLSEAESRKTINSGLQAGYQNPRQAPEKEDIKYDLSVNQQNQQNQQNQHSHNPSAKISIRQQKSAKISNESSEAPPEPPHNLRAAIFDFIENSKGSFTTRDIDLEFGLTTRKEKNARSAALSMASKNKLIKKDKRAAGKYHIINTEMEVVDLDNVSEEPFPMYLPFNLHNYVKIPKHAIIVLAGSSNAGKTALMLETLRLNIKQKYEKHYYMSEMAPGEYKSRVLQFDTPISEWKKVTAASKSYDFEGAIEAYNPNGLTCIDYLEEVDGEYFKIASSIREIYDALGDGVAMIAVQKKKASEVAFGGEATVQKSRLYLVLDFLCSKEHSIVCALKVYKLKEPRGNKNLTDHEMHFEIHSGSKFNVLMDWTPSSRVNRQNMAAQYETGRQDIEMEDFVFPTIEGQSVLIRQSQVETWQQTFENIDVSKELAKLSESNRKKPFIKYKGVMFQLANILGQKSKEVPF